jgi:hypothetical protein
MTPASDDALPEPWPGYASQSKAERRAELKSTVDAARERGDDRYAQAVASAVALYERHEREDDDRSEPEQEARAHFDDVGGWGHK